MIVSIQSLNLPAQPDSTCTLATVPYRRVEDGSWPRHLGLPGPLALQGLAGDVGPRAGIDAACAVWPETGLSLSLRRAAFAWRSVHVMLLWGPQLAATPHLHPPRGGGGAVGKQCAAALGRGRMRMRMTCS